MSNCLADSVHRSIPGIPLQSCGTQTSNSLTQTVLLLPRESPGFRSICIPRNRLNSYVDEVGDERAAIQIDKKNAGVIYAINPREVKYDPRTITNAAMIFYAAGEDWTMASFGWDQTNFGLFSGDDVMAGNTYKHLEEKFKELGGKKLVISECGHGYRSTRCEGPNWSATNQDFIMESSVITMLNYIKEGKIKVDKTRNSLPITFHDSCNNARSCGLFEEPRELLQYLWVKHGWSNTRGNGIMNSQS